MVDSREQLLSLLTLGNHFQQREALNDALDKVAEDPRAVTGGLVFHMWSARVAKTLVDEVPKMIAEHGTRPAEAVAAIVSAAVALGVEIGQHYPPRP